MPILEIVSGYLGAIFVNASYDILKGIFKSKDDPLFKALENAVEKAAERFFEQYGDEFGTYKNSFLARQENWDTIISSLFLSTEELSPSSLNPEGYEVKPASLEAITFFIEALLGEIKQHFGLDKIVAQKKHLKDTKEILDQLNTQQSTLADIASKTEKTYEGLKDSSLAQSEKISIIVQQGEQLAQQGAQSLEILKSLLTISVGSQPDDDKVDRIINEQIDQCRDLINQNKPRTAIGILTGLKDRRWEELSDKARFRIATNIAAAKLNLGQKDEAAKGLLEAEKLAPHDMKALCNTTLAYIILGEKDKALEKARQATATYPDSPEGFAILIAAAAHDLTIDNPFELFPDKYLNSPDVAFRLYEFWINRNNHREAKRWISIAFELDPQNTDIREGYAVNLLYELFEDHAVTFGRQINPAQLTQLQIARDILDGLWKQFKDSEVPKRFIPCAINLSNVERLLGNNRNARQILKNAIYLNPDDYQLKRQAAFLAMEDEQFDEASKILADITDQAFEGKLFMEAEALRATHKYPQALAKIEAFLLTVQNPESKVNNAANAMRVHILKDAEGIDAAAKEAAKLASDYPEIIDYIVLASQVSLDKGSREEALAWAEKAKALIEKESGYVNRSLVADIYFQLGLYREAVDLYSKIVVSPQNTRDLRRLLICLMETDRRREALDIISQLSEEVRNLPFFSKICAELYNRAGDLPESRKYLEVYLCKEPGDLRARLTWIVLTERMGKKDEVHEFLEHLPEFPKAKVEDYVHLSHTLFRYGKQEQAIELSYKTLRENKSVANAHMGYMGLMLCLVKIVPEIERVKITQCVETDTAFIVKMESGEKKIFLIEGGKNSGMMEEEIAIDNPIAQRAIGLKTGDNLVVIETPFKKEEGKIIEVKHKYLYVLHKSMQNFEYLFPKATSLFSVPIKTDEEGNPDFKPILDAVSKRQEAVLRVENLYRTQPFPIDMITKSLGVTAIDGWFGLCGGGRVKILCCNGDQQERLEAFKLFFVQREGFIIDPITLYILFLSGVLDEINAFSRSGLGVTQSTLDLYWQLAEVRKNTSSHASMGKEGEKFVVTEYCKEDIEKSIEPFENLLNWCRENSEIIPAVGKKVLSEIEEGILSGFDTAYVDTLLAAEGSGRTLLSDDLYYRQFAHHVFGVNGVWSQPLLNCAVDAGFLSKEKYVKATVALLDLNYSFIYFSADDLLFAVIDNNFGIGAVVQKILNTLASTGVNIISAMSMVSNFLLMLWVCRAPYLAKEKITYAVLNSVTSNPARNQLIILYQIYLLLCRSIIVDNMATDETLHELRDVLRKWSFGHFLPVLF